MNALNSEMIHPPSVTFIRTGLISWLLFGTLGLFAQSVDSLDARNLWVSSMLERVAIEVSVNNDVESFILGDVNFRQVLKPNLGTNLRFYFRYRFLGLGVQWAPHFIPGNREDHLKGSSIALRLRAALPLKHWNTELIYNRIKGYYLENTSDFIPWQEGDPYLQFPNLNFAGLRLKVIYIANARFSYRSIIDQADRQLKSAGSFTPALTMRHYIVDDRSASVGTQRSVNVEASLGPGYSYTFVLGRNYFLSLSGTVSIGYLHTTLTTRLATADLKTGQDNFIFRGEGITGIGYNGDRFYTGVFYTLSTATFRQQHTTVINHETLSVYRVFLGIRFQPPGFLRRTTDRIKEIVPLL